MNESPVETFLNKAPFIYALSELVDGGPSDASDVRFLKVNEAFKDFMHVDTGQAFTFSMLQQRWLTDDYDWVGYFERVVKTGEPSVTHRYIKVMDKWFTLYTYPIDESRFEIFLIDTTDIHALDLETSQLKSGLDLIETYIYMKDVQSRYIYANAATLDLFGTTAEGIKGKYDHDFFDEKTANNLQAIDKKVLKFGRNREELETYDSNGNRRFYLEIKAPVYEDSTKEPTGIIGVSTDITEQKILERENRYLLDHDQLTDAHTRTYIFNHMEKLMDEGVPFSVAILDLDRFKAINDTHGHMAGDQVLRTFVERLESHISDHDLVGRFGGEEFIVLFERTSKEASRKTLTSFLDSLKQDPIRLKASPIFIRFSGGLHEVRGNHEGVGLEDVLAIADRRLFKAKENGRAQIADHD